jgi:hypothetical protein
MPQLEAAGPERPRQQSLPCAGEASIRSSEEQDRSRHHSTHRGGAAGVEHWDGAVRWRACRSAQCCLAVWSRWVESSTRLGGFRALKKTPEGGALHYRSEQSLRALLYGFSRGPTPSRF